jgi:steroid 5-alpha reductase family enzyme
VYLFALPALVSAASPARALLAALSPAFITFLLLKVSGVPLLERAADAAYQGDEKYLDYKRKTPILCPGLY